VTSGSFPSPHPLPGSIQRPGLSQKALGMLSIACFALPLALGCKGSVKADAKASTNGDSEMDFDAEGKRDEAWESEALPASNSKARTSETQAPGQTPTTAAAMLGARHDLAPAGGQQPACQCLTVVAGAPNRSGLTWSAAPPQIDVRTQLVVALSSDQVTCPVEVPKASYMGYEVREADVVIQVEGAVAGRPLTQGAIVPRPMTGGKLLIESAPNLPYGKPTSGQGTCSVAY